MPTPTKGPRVGGGGRHQFRALVRLRVPVRAAWAPVCRRARGRPSPRDRAAHDGARHLDQPDPLLLQPDSDSAARRIPPAVSRAAAQGGQLVSRTSAFRLSSALRPALRLQACHQCAPDPRGGDDELLRRHDVEHRIDDVLGHPFLTQAAIFRPAALILRP